MTPAIRASDGDWGGALVRDVEAVARSAAGSFPAFDDDDEALAIVLEPTRNRDDPPMASLPSDGSDEFVIRLNVRGRLWARLAYQFAHEFCHLIADLRTWPGGRDRFAWVEEALCETASLFALRSMSRTWAVHPPYRNWGEYSTSLADYERNQTSRPGRTPPAGVPFRDWLADRLPLLEADLGRRDDNTIVAKELLPLFETEPGAWRALRWLHTWPRSQAAPLADFMNGWERACPAELRHVVRSIAALLVIRDEEVTPQGA